MATPEMKMSRRICSAEPDMKMADVKPETLVTRIPSLVYCFVFNEIPPIPCRRKVSTFCPTVLLDLEIGGTFRKFEDIKSETRHLIHNWSDGLQFGFFVGMA